MGSVAGVTTGIMERLRVFGDESGCTGYAFNDNSSIHYAIALVVVNDADSLKQAVESWHLKRWSQRRELHFKDMKPSERCDFLRFLKSAEGIPYDVRALVVNKKRLPDNMRPSTGEVYEHFVAEAFSRCGDVISGAIVKMDKTNHGGPHVLSRIQRAVNTETGCRTIHDLQFENSHSNYAIQVADAYCGAIYKAYEKKESQYLEIVKERVQINERWTETSPAYPRASDIR